MESYITGFSRENLRKRVKDPYFEKQINALSVALGVNVVIIVPVNVSVMPKNNLKNMVIIPLLLL